MSDFPQMSAPETSYAAPKQESSWPKAIGIISIVIASVGIAYYVLCGIGGTLVNTALVEAMAESVPEAQRAQMEASAEIQQRYLVPNLASSCFALALAGFLLVAGIATTRRRRWCRGGSLAWAGGKLLHALGAAVIVFLSAQASAEIMANDPNMQQMGGLSGIMAALGPISAVLTFLFLAAYPVFLIIWFNRGKVVEEVRGWE